MKYSARNRMVLASLCLGALLIAPNSGHAFNDPDWPCVQRKVVNLSIGQMWGAELPPEDADWRDDAEIATLAPILAARRTSMERVEELVEAFPKSEYRDARLTLLFAGVFEIIERQRHRLIDGITRYASKQRALANLIDTEQTEIATLRAKTAEDDYDALDLLDEREDKLHWDTRIYQERNQSLTYVCESPVILEKRGFAIGQIIQHQLGK
ncbi:hypothetical protein KHP62_07705 [Rhodobacteraceae bacterium NNCM2]|nr:hypothetical protein [Coraliihabitans acroporae]